MVNWYRKPELPLQYKSEQSTQAKAEDALAYLKRKDATDLVEILGLDEGEKMASALIPVYLAGNLENVVAQAYLKDDGKVTIEIPAGAFTAELENLVVVNQIRYLNIDVGYQPPAQPAVPDGG